jgi:glycopeptide antibiotics resistance protein
MANLLLFVPAGFFATLATRRPVRIALAGIAIPFLIETYQAISGVRVASAADWLHNSTGALIGVVAASVLLPLTRRSRDRARSHREAPRIGALPHRELSLIMAGTAVVTITS